MALREVEAITKLKKRLDELQLKLDNTFLDNAEIEDDRLVLYLADGRKIKTNKLAITQVFSKSIERAYISNNHLHIVYSGGEDQDVGVVSGGSGAVNSVNGKTGDVVLGYEDVGASKSDHTHSEYASVDHNHDTEYADIDHEHSEYALVEHTHSEYAQAVHTHSFNDLSDKPTIPTKLSEFTDDLGNSPTHTHSQYLESSALEGLATETYVDNSVDSEKTLRENADTELQTAINGKASSDHTHDGRYYTKSSVYTKDEVNNLITFVVHLQDGENDTLYADYTFAQILAAINRMQWVILKYQEQTYTVYERDNSHILWQSTRYYTSTLTTKLFNLTSADVWSKESQTLSLNDIKPIVVHITKEGSVVTADYTFDQLIGAVSDQVIECCYNGNHVPMGTHTSQKITFTAQDVDMDTGATTEVVIEVDDTNEWRMLEDTYIPLKQDKLLYDYIGGLRVDGTLNSTYIDENGMLITTGSSGSWDAWNITDMDLHEFKTIRFVCYRDSSNTGGTWVCDVPLLTPIQISGGVGFFVSSGAMNSFGDRNRWNVLQAGVRWNNGNIDAISIGQVFSLYGTAATTVSGIKCCAVYGVY